MPGKSKGVLALAIVIIVLAGLFVVNAYFPQILTRFKSSVISAGKNCFDTIDNDGDTLIDQDDLDCFVYPHEVGYYTTEVNLSSTCSDSIDNDQDGTVDLNDQDCVGGLEYEIPLISFQAYQNRLTRPICGNGKIDQNEDCDDRNTFNGDGCDSTCHREVSEIMEKKGCGDGKLDLEAGEECDDGNTIAGDGCSATCTMEPLLLPLPGRMVTCGNGFVEGEEECDDGNTVSEDGCSATCMLETTDNMKGFRSTATMVGKPATIDENAGNRSGLMASYSFEEEGQKIIDSSGNNQHGKMMASTQDKNKQNGSVINTPSSQTLVAGKVGKALRLTFENYVELPDIGDFKGGPLTIAFWAKPEKEECRNDSTGLSSGGCDPNPREGGQLLNKMIEGYGKGWYFSLSGGNAMIRAISNISDEYQGTDIEKQENFHGWHHFVFVIDSTDEQSFKNTKIYVDGVLSPWKQILATGFSRYKAFQGSTDIPDPLYIGGLPLSENRGINANFSGLIDELKIYDRALSEAEIQALYNGNATP